MVKEYIYKYRIQEIILQYLWMIRPFNYLLKYGDLSWWANHFKEDEPREFGANELFLRGNAGYDN